MLWNPRKGNGSQQPLIETATGCKERWVRESRFGRWFLSTDIWRRYVLGEALDALLRILGEPRIPVGHILDVGCGQGSAFGLLDEAMRPGRITGVDIDGELIDEAATEARRLKCVLHVTRASALQLPLDNATVDLVFCHQLLHHMTCQADALAEMLRVLRPGGLLLVSESCRRFIESSLVRLLFRHPMPAQRSAKDFVEIVRNAGFAVEDKDIEMDSPWWSRRDFGLGLMLGWAGNSNDQPTEVFVVGRKPEPGDSALRAVA